MCALAVWVRCWWSVFQDETPVRGCKSCLNRRSCFSTGMVQHSRQGSDVPLGPERHSRCVSQHVGPQVNFLQCSNGQRSPVYEALSLPSASLLSGGLLSGPQTCVAFQIRSGNRLRRFVASSLRRFVASSLRRFVASLVLRRFCHFRKPDIERIVAPVAGMDWLFPKAGCASPDRSECAIAVSLTFLAKRETPFEQMSHAGCDHVCPQGPPILSVFLDSHHSMCLWLDPLNP